MYKIEGYDKDSDVYELIEKSDNLNYFIEETTKIAFA